MIDKPGIYEISAEEYHADPVVVPSLSSSIAKLLINRSPLHAWTAHPRLNPDFKRAEKSVLDAGTIAHQLLLQGNEDNLVVVEADDWKKKLSQELRDLAWEAGKTPVLVGKLETIRKMVSIAREYVALSDLAGIFDKGKPELTLAWQEGPTWCRARPDFWTDDHALMIDYKSTATSAEPNTFVRQMLTMGYDLQCAHYSRGAVALAKEVPDFVFLVQENSPPYACSLIQMAGQMVDLGERKLEHAYTLWKNCMTLNRWNGYSPRIQTVEAPEWAVRSFEEIIDAGGQA